MAKLSKSEIIKLWREKFPRASLSNGVCKECYNNYIKSPYKLFGIQATTIAGTRKLHLYRYNIEFNQLVGFCEKSPKVRSDDTVILHSDILELGYRIALLNDTISRIKKIIPKLVLEMKNSQKNP